MRDGGKMEIKEIKLAGKCDSSVISSIISNVYRPL